MSKVLLTFVGFHDPHHRGAIEDEELKGPILYLLGLRSFDRALELAEGSQAGAARLLGVTPQAVGKYLRKDDEGHVAADSEIR
jgi:hypothetical protein